MGSMKKKETGISSLDGGRWRVQARIRVSGKIIQRRETVTCTRETAKAKLAEIKKSLRGDTPESGSLTVGIKTFDEALSFYLSRHEAGRSKPYFDRLKNDLGNVPIADLAGRFDEYIELLKQSTGKRTGAPLENATINQYIARANCALNFCAKPPFKKIPSNPLAGYPKLSETERDRVLTDAERERLLNTLQEMNSHLYWAVYFSLKNPIRRGDLFNLKRENLDRFKPWIHFYPSKTRKRKPRETCLIFLDEALLKYFDSLPADTPYLFPRIQRNEKKETLKWYPMGEIKTHWAEVLKRAKIQDFHFHDLKHCSETWMIDSGYTERDLKNLGIQYSQKMIDRYYKHDAEKVLKKWENSTFSGKRENAVKTFEPKTA
jgi:integrase